MLRPTTRPGDEDDPRRDDARPTGRRGREGEDEEGDGGAQVKALKPFNSLLIQLYIQQFNFHHAKSVMYTMVDLARRIYVELGSVDNFSFLIAGP